MVKSKSFLINWLVWQNIEENNKKKKMVTMLHTEKIRKIGLR